MQSPFDTKNRAATALDHLALHLAMLAASIVYFYILWRKLPESLMAGSALFALLLLTLALWERCTLNRRDRALRERIGGAIALQELLLMPGTQAVAMVRDLLCSALGAQSEGDALMRCEGQLWLIRCAQCAPGANASEGDVLAAFRARSESGADQCALVSTGGFSPAAVRAAEWVDPPLRLIAGDQLSALFGRLHPATDEEIARHARRQRTPYSFARMKSLALSPVKLRRYLLCAFILLIMYLTTSSPVCLISCLMAFLLALFCYKENSRRFHL